MTSELWISRRDPRIHFVRYIKCQIIKNQPLKFSAIGGWHSKTSIVLHSVSFQNHQSSILFINDIFPNLINVFSLMFYIRWRSRIRLRLVEAVHEEIDMHHQLHQRTSSCSRNQIRIKKIFLLLRKVSIRFLKIVIWEKNRFSTF